MKKWYLIKTKPRQEKKAKKNLENQSYEIFCPTVKLNNKFVFLFPGYLFIQLNDNDIQADVRFIYSFIMGHSVWLSLGIFDIEEFTDNLKQYEIFEVIIQNSTNFVATEYFDIETNYWYLNGLKSALSQGKNLCLSSIS